MGYNVSYFISLKEEKKMIVEVTNDENREEHERLLWEFEVEQGKLDCLLYFHSRERDDFIKERDDFIKEHDEQEERIRDFGEAWLNIYEQIRELYCVYGARPRGDNFRSDFKVVFEKAISDVNDDFDDSEFDF